GYYPSFRGLVGHPQRVAELSDWGCGKYLRSGDGRLHWRQTSGRDPAPGSNICRYERPSRRQALAGPASLTPLPSRSGVFNISGQFFPCFAPCQAVFTAEAAGFAVTVSPLGRICPTLIPLLHLLF